MSTVWAVSWRPLHQRGHDFTAVTLHCSYWKLHFGSFFCGLRNLWLETKKKYVRAYLLKKMTSHMHPLCHHYPPPSVPHERNLPTAIKRHFPANPAWREQVWKRWELLTSELPCAHWLTPRAGGRSPGQSSVAACRNKNSCRDWWKNRFSWRSLSSACSDRNELPLTPCASPTSGSSVEAGGHLEVIT